MLSPDDPRYARVHRIIVSQAVTGESVGIEHYAKMIALCPGLPERLALLEDAWRERHHLVAVQDAAREMGLTIEDGRDDPYWSRIRTAFDECAARGDLIACRMVQDVVLECFAVTLYRCLVGRVDSALTGRFERIAADEEQHLRHGLEEARRAFESDPQGLSPAWSSPTSELRGYWRNGVAPKTVGQYAASAARSAAAAPNRISRRCSWISSVCGRTSSLATARSCARRASRPPPSPAGWRACLREPHA